MLIMKIISSEYKIERDCFDEYVELGYIFKPGDIIITDGEPDFYEEYDYVDEPTDGYVGTHIWAKNVIVIDCTFYVFDGILCIPKNAEVQQVYQGKKYKCLDGVNFELAG